LLMDFATQAPELRHKVSQMIMATEKHQLPDDAPHDLRYFLDFDLEVLSWEAAGSTPSPPSSTNPHLSGSKVDICTYGFVHSLCVDYERYAQQIRGEYIHIPDDKFRTGRAAVLHNFLKREVLYFTQDFRDKHEAQARDNLTREIGLLESLQ